MRRVWFFQFGCSQSAAMERFAPTPQHHEVKINEGCESFDMFMKLMPNAPFIATAENSRTTR
jgi:hypothetical protein